MNCNDFETLMADALGNELSPADRPIFEAHLRDCLKCRGEYESTRRAVATMRELPGPARVTVRREGDRLVIEDKPPKHVSGKANTVRRGRLRTVASSLLGPALGGRGMQPAARGALFRYAASVLIAFSVGYALNDGAVGNQSPVGGSGQPTVPIRPSQADDPNSPLPDYNRHHTLRGALVSAYAQRPARSDLAKCLVAIAGHE